MSAQMRPFEMRNRNPKHLTDTFLLPVRWRWVEGPPKALFLAWLFLILSPGLLAQAKWPVGTGPVGATVSLAQIPNGQAGICTNSQLFFSSLFLSFPVMSHSLACCSLHSLRGKLGHLNSSCLRCQSIYVSAIFSKSA